jgi:hypothetical protein
MPNHTDYLNNVTVIVRSVGERTETVCHQLIIEQGVPPEAIFTINEAPFSKAMRVGFEIGLEQDRPWTFCVDADLLLRSGTIEQMVGLVEMQPSNVCEIQGYVLDKYFGGARMAGNHIYRTSLLHKVIDCIPEEGVDIRPETHALNRMKAKGYPWVSMPVLVGLHDFEQSYEDIFRKCFVQAHKHLSHTELFVPFWRSKSADDIDYRIALAGFAEGIKHFGEVRIDKRAQYLLDAMRYLNLESKNDLNLDQWSLARIDSIIRSWEEPEGYWQKYPFGMDANSGSILSRAVEMYRSQREKRSSRESGMVVLSWLLTGAGNKLRSLVHFP